MVIIEESFSQNQAAILYMCETGDGKQHMCKTETLRKKIIM